MKIKALRRSAAMWFMMAGLVGGKTWTDKTGRSFEAEFVRIEGANVVLVLPNGRAFTKAIADLSEADQASLRQGVKVPTPPVPSAPAGTGTTQPPGGLRPAAAAEVPSNFGRPWPRDVRMDGASACKVISEDAKSRRYIYESPGYRFTCDARITDDALRNLSVMFETTRMFAKNLPLSLGGKERNGKLDILLFGEMTDYIRSGAPPGSAGCFVPSLNLVMVPMESLGLKKGSTGFSLDIKKKNDVLVHELAHQLTPDAYFASGALGWFSEGLAEYMAATPYNWGYFAPDVHGNVVKSYVTGTGVNNTGGRGLGTTISAPKLRTFFLMDYRLFSGGNGNANYGLGLLVTHYFFHMEGGGKAYRITNFLKGLRQGARGEEALKPLLGGGTYEKLEADIATEWAKKGVVIRFGG